MGFNNQGNDEQSDRILQVLVRRGLSAEALKGTPPAALAEFSRYLDAQDGGLSQADADQYDEDQEVAKLKGQCEKFSESGVMPTPVGTLIKGFRAERKYNPGLTADEFMGRR